MVSAMRILLACISLALVSLTAIAVTHPSGGKESANDSAAEQTGPVLLAPGARYLNQAVKTGEPSPVMLEPAAEDVLPPDHDESAAADQVEEQAQQPLQEPSDEEPQQAPEEEQEQTPEDAADATQAEEPQVPEPAPKPELTPAQVAQRTRVRRTLASYRQALLSTSENTATELMHYCLAFGCGSEVYRAGFSGQKLNGITCLCWNYPCAGYQPLRICEGHIAARVGYGMQEQRSQLLAMLALSGVQADYPMRVGDDVRNVADLVESEKLGCRSATDLSLTLIGLTNYLPDDRPWKNALGEDWSTERIVEEELAQPVIGTANGGTQRLLGLGYVLYRRAQRGQPLEGQFCRAEEFIAEFHNYALKLQNRDGSWGPRGLAGRGASRDPATQLRSTADVLQWLAISLPEDRLADPQVVQSVEYVNGLLANQGFLRGLRSLRTRDIAGVSHALHALSIYDQRFFQPRTPPSPPPKAVAQAAE
jgi:hypothetical protein